MRPEPFFTGEKLGASRMTKLVTDGRRRNPMYSDDRIGLDTGAGFIQETPEEPFVRRVPEDQISFGFNLISKPLVRIFPGTVLHGHLAFDIAQTDVTLPAGDSFVYILYKYEQSASIPDPVSVRPQTTDKELVWPIGIFRFIPAANITKLVRRLWAGGDIQLQSIWNPSP